MAHHHDHHDHHHVAPDHINRAFVLGIILNMVFVVVEVVAGFTTHSLALLSDAGHNLSDVASLAMALLALRLAKVKPTQRYTYGFRKATVLVALLNAAILLLAVGGIVYEAVLRLNNPQPLPGKTIALVAFFGIIINSITAWLFMKDKEKDLNVKSAYLHLAADALVSLGVVIAGGLMMITNWLWLDSVISILIALVILLGTWDLLKASLRLSLDGVPQNVDLEKIREKVLALPQVRDFRHIHVWAMSTTKNALTGHIVVNEQLDLMAISAIKDAIRHTLLHLNIHHCTLEVDSSGVVDDGCD